MRRFVIFLSIVFSIYGSLSYYIYTKGCGLLAGLPPASHWRSAYTASFLGASVAFLVGRLLQRRFVNWITDTLVLVGSLWLAAWVYFLVAALASDLARALLAGVALLGWAIAIPGWAGTAAGGATCLAVFLTVAVGCVNAQRPIARVVRLEIPVQPGWRRLAGQTARLALATDIHLGSPLSRSLLCRIILEINALRPDLVLLGGDILDEDMAPLLKRDFDCLLRQLQARDGVLAVTGNHEYIGGIRPAVAYLKRHGIVLLRDTWTIRGDLVIVGREDHMKAWSTGVGREPLDRILQDLDRSRPIIVMDHQPIGLKEAVTNGITLQVSGHTHHGQLWPISHLTRALYECDWGLLRKGTTQFYVSCGAGTWGPPVRTSCRPEIALLELNFTKNDE